MTKQTDGTYLYYEEFKDAINRLGGLAQRSLNNVQINFHSHRWRSILNISDNIIKHGTDQGAVDDLCTLCDKIDMPNLKIASEDAVEAQNQGGVYKGIGQGVVIPESNTFSMLFYDTETSILEEIMLPWLYHVGDPNPDSEVYPFLRADVIVNIYGNHMSMHDSPKYSYRLTDCYPIQVDTPNLEDGMGDIKRSVAMEFNKMILNERYK